MQTAAHEEKLVRFHALRAEIAEKFPEPVRKSSERLKTGCPGLDGLSGGLCRGALTEICGTAAGGQLALGALLDVVTHEGSFLGLIDPADTFEPADWEPSALARLLWLRGGGAVNALKATDILLRDGNLPVVVLDLQIIPRAELRKIPASTWHRFQHIAEATVLAVLTSEPLVTAAPARIAVHAIWTLDVLDRPRADLIATLNTQIFERSLHEITTPIPPILRAGTG